VTALAWPRKAERRPRQGGIQEMHSDGGIDNSVTRCPLVRGALASGDVKVMLAVITYHPKVHCAAARRERAA
jgi:hypothetical protein